MDEKLELLARILEFSGRHVFCCSIALVETPQESKYTDTESEQTVKRYRRGSTTCRLFCFVL